MPPKIRSPLTSWLLTVSSSGIYLLFWVWHVANELNSAENKKVLNIRLWRKLFMALIVLVISGLVWTVQTNNPIPVFVPFLLLFSLVLYVQLAIGNYIKAKDEELKTGASYSNALSIFLLWCVANTGVAYMQAGINRVIEHERKRYPGSA